MSGTQERAAGSRILAFLAAMIAASPRRDLLFAALLVPMGFLLEGAGILLLVPILGLVLDEGGLGSGPAAFAERLIGWTGAETLANRLLLLLLLFGLLMIVRAVAIGARDRNLARLQIRFVERLRVEALSEVASAPWHRLVRLRHGRVLALLSGDIQACGAAAHHAIQSLVSLVLLVGYAGLTFLVSPALAGFSLLVVLLFAALLVPLVRDAMATGGAMSRATLAMADALAQLLGGLKLAKSLGGVGAYLDRLQRDQADLSRAHIRYMLRQSRARIALTTAIALAAALLVYAGFIWFGLSAPELAAMLLLLSRLGGPALQIQQGSHALSASVPAYERLNALRAEVRSREAEAPAADPDILPRRALIRLEQIVFRHEDGATPILDRVDLLLPPGQFVGLGGPSGAGKSTLADLMAALLEPDEGRILIGDVVLEPPLYAAWRERIAYVPQEAFLLNDSIRANLAWGRGAIGDEEMWSALDAVGIRARVEAMGGLGAAAGERGQFLSGGERQRIGLARALLRRPELLILDEATSGLDAASEQKVLAAIRALDPRPAALIISHSPDVLRACDEIRYLEQGRLVDPKLD